MPSKSAVTIAIQFRSLFVSKRLGMELIYYRVWKWRSFMLVTTSHIYGVDFRR